MKKWMILLMMCMAVCLTGCQKQEEKEEAAVPTVQIAYSAFQYEQGYVPAEGWMYEMTLSAAGQIEQLNGLLGGVQFEMLDEEFVMDTGYRLIFRDAEGNMTREMLLMQDDRASMNGSVYQTQNAQPLTDWLEALRIEEQSVAG